MNWTLRLMSCSPCILAWTVNDGELSVSYFSLIRLNYIMNDFYLLQRVKCEIINSAMMRFVCSLAAFFFCCAPQTSRIHVRIKSFIVDYNQFTLHYDFGWMVRCSAMQCMAMASSQTMHDNFIISLLTTYISVFVCVTNGRSSGRAKWEGKKV